MKRSIYGFLIPVLVASGCGGGTSVGNPESTTEDSSTSGVAASAAGGAISGTESSGTLASLFMPGSSRSRFFAMRDALSFNSFQSAFASSVCPTYKSSGIAGCDSSGSTLWLTYDSCSFGGGSSTWTGTQALIMSTGSASCGSFPDPGAGGNLIRQYASGSASSTPGSATNESSRGTTATIDNASANLSNFNGDTITTLANSGYGDEIHFKSALIRDSVTIDQHIVVSGQLDHSITGSLTISEDGVSTTRSISGDLTVYHNLMYLIGTSKFVSVIHEDGCCLPVSGKIETSFTNGSAKSPTSAGSAYVGKTETLEFTGCGTATLTAVDGSVSSVALTRCF